VVDPVGNTSAAGLGNNPEVDNRLAVHNTHLAEDRCNPLDHLAHSNHLRLLHLLHHMPEVGSSVDSLAGDRPASC
jgi:hypothetical protein